MVNKSGQAGAIDGDSSEFPHGCSRNDIFQTEEDRQGNGVSVDIAQSVGGPSDEVLADRPNLGEFLKANLAESNPRYDIGNFAAEYMSVKLSNDKRRGLRIRDFGISSCNTFS
jgi:hypothetical protein